MLVRSAVRATVATLLLVCVLAVLLSASLSRATASSGPAGAIHLVAPADTGQVIVVSAPASGASVATVTAYSWTAAGWEVQIGPISAGIGENGFTTTPSEADGFTPVGEYAVTGVFGDLPDPGTRMAYRTATSNDYWVDDPTSPLYNTWQTGPAGGRWNSAESLSSYSYAISFDFNQNPVVPNGNSAIFLHEGGGATPGCIEIDRSDLVSLMRWLDPAQHPRILLGVNVGPPPHESSAPPPTAAPTTVPSTTVPATTAAPTTVSSTAVPATAAPTTVPSTTVPATAAPTTAPSTTVAFATDPSPVAPLEAAWASMAADAPAGALAPPVPGSGTSRGIVSPLRSPLGAGLASGGAIVGGVALTRAGSRRRARARHRPMRAHSVGRGERPPAERVERGEALDRQSP